MSYLEGCGGTSVCEVVYSMRGLVLMGVCALAVSACGGFTDKSHLEGYCFNSVTGRYELCAPDAQVDAGVHPDAEADAGPVDTGEWPDALVPEDAGPVDMGVLDSGVHPDAEPVDVGFPDTGIWPDAEPVDVGFPDSGVHPDAMPVDMGVLDSGVHPDAAPVDAGSPDAGFVDLTVVVNQSAERDQVTFSTGQGVALCGFLLPSPCTLAVPAFTFLPITAAPDAWNGGSVFQMWGGAASGCGSNTRCTLFTSGNLTVDATFAPQ